MRTIQDALIFPQYTRESYRATFGIQAPDYDPSWGVKSWVDPAARPDKDKPAIAITYPTAFDGTFVPKALLVSPEHAGVNLPGLMDYPLPVYPETAATLPSGQAVNSRDLISQADAEALRKDLNGTGLWDQGATIGRMQINYRSETRRDFVFTLPNGQQISAADLYAQKNAFGVGAPGIWDTTSGSALWVPAPRVAATPKLPQVPLPIKLLAGESIKPSGGAISVPQIVTDADNTAPAGGGDGFSQGERNEILTTLRELRAGNARFARWLDGMGYPKQ